MLQTTRTYRRTNVPRACDDPIDRRIAAAGNAVDDAMDVARIALAQHANAGFDVMQPIGAVRSFDFTTINAKASASAALAALIDGERPRVAAPVQQPSPTLVVELARKTGGELIAIPGSVEAQDRSMFAPPK